MARTSSGATPPVLQVRDLTVAYGATTAVARTALELPAGGVTALLGPSGCGKTSLLRAIAGFEVPRGGEVRIAGRKVAGGGAWVPPEERRVGMVFQQGGLFPHMTVWQNVLYGVKRLPAGKDRAWESLDRVGMAACADRYPDQLSGGQQQRVALARALAPEPPLLLLDEPFACLDAGLRQEVRVLVREILDGSGATSLLVTHDQEEALSFADRVAVMLDGRIVQVARPQELYLEPASLEVARFVGDGQFLPCEVVRGRARSPFGDQPCELDDGAGWLWVRPENLQLEAAGDAVESSNGAPTGVIVDRQYFGHDLLDSVELEDGTRLVVRQLSSVALSPGEPVRVRLRSARLPVFARANGH